MITLSECGSFPDVDNLVADGAGWLYYMPWYGNYTRSSTYNSLDLWKKMFAHSYVLTLDEMPDLKSYTTGVPEIQNQVNKTDLQIFPTFVTDEINLRAKKAIKNVAIFNSQGKLYRSFVINSEAFVISVSGFESGVYFIKADNYDTVKIFKN